MTNAGIQRCAPIAFIDSGVGGLPYLQLVKEQLRAVPLVYVADNRGFPYGLKDEEEIRSSVFSMTDRLVDRYHPELVVVACNTASVVALEGLRARFKLDFVGVVPAIKPAAQKSVVKCIGVMASEMTVKGRYLDNLIEEFAPGCRVVKVAASELIAAIEHDPFMEDRRSYNRLLTEIRDRFEAEGVDTVVLGCTHFLHLSEELRSVFGDRFEALDSRDGVCRQVGRILESHGSLERYRSGSEPDLRVFHLTAGDPNTAVYEQVAAKYGLEFGGQV